MSTATNGNGYSFKLIWWLATTLGAALLAFASSHVHTVMGTLALHGERLAAIETQLRGVARQLDRIEERVTPHHPKPEDRWQDPVRASNDALQTAQRAAVRVEVPGAQGSGCIISWQGQPFILTCAHVVRPPGMPAAVRADVTLPDQQRQLASIVAINPAADLALLQASLTSGYLALEVADADPLAQTPILTVGYPGGAASWQLHQGYVAQPRGGPTLGGQPALVTSFAPTPGLSGAAVVRQADQTLVGVIAERRYHTLTGQTDGIAIRACEIRAFLTQSCPGGVCPLPPRMAPARPPAPTMDLRGPPGPEGKPGERGPPGPPGAAADVTPLKEEVARLRLEIDALRKQFNSLSGTIRVQVEPVKR